VRKVFFVLFISLFTTSGMAGYLASSFKEAAAPQRQVIRIAQVVYMFRIDLKDG